MITVFSDKHRFHAAEKELYRGKLEDCFERPKRADDIHQHIADSGFGKVVPPAPRLTLDPILRIHDGRYVEFLRTIYQEWFKAHPDRHVIPHVWSCRSLRPVEPNSIYGRLGYFSFDAGTPICAGTWKAAVAAAHVAITGQRLVSGGEPAAFALTRPPGHHAARDVYGGYCFFNNAAIAAQAFLDTDHTAKRVAILDVDYHHGNGTQSIFYRRKDVLFVSLHADPANSYPYFLGYADETGEGPGEGFNFNYPLTPHTTWNAYGRALDTALAEIDAKRPAYLVVSLGVDTFKEDPIDERLRFRLERRDFVELGKRIGELKMRTLFVMEGGYHTGIGENVVNVLRGFEDA